MPGAPLDGSSSRLACIFPLGHQQFPANDNHIEKGEGSFTVLERGFLEFRAGFGSLLGFGNCYPNATLSFVHMV